MHLILTSNMFLLLMIFSVELYGKNNNLIIIDSGLVINNNKIGTWKYISEDSTNIKEITFCDSLFFCRNKKRHDYPSYFDVHRSKNYYLNEAYSGVLENNIMVISGLYVRYYPNGKESIRTGYLNGVYHGLFISYFENGNVNFIGIFKNGKKQGSWIEYNKEGIAISVGNYDSDLKMGEWCYYHSNGNMKSKGNYFPNYLTVNLEGSNNSFCVFRDSLGVIVDQKLYADIIRLTKAELQVKQFQEYPFIVNFKTGLWLEWDDKGILIKKSNWDKGKLLKSSDFNR